ncbi:MAG: flagellar FliJ family protein [Deltaproteobacteria bacterium]
MKRFKFRLDPVLRYRRYREELALMELARARRALVLSEKKLEQIQQTRQGVMMDLDARQAERLEVNRYRIYRAYLKGLGAEIETEKEHLADIGREVRDKYETAEANRISRETLQWVRQTQYTDYLQMSDRAEQKGAEELIALSKRSGVDDTPCP